MMSKKLAHRAPLTPQHTNTWGLATKLRFWGAGVLTVALLTGCGLRLETSVPQPIVPDANELSRQAMVNDFVLIQQDAQLTLEAGTLDPATTATLTAVLDRNAQYEELLGGVYSSGLPQDDSEFETTASSLASSQTAAENHDGQAVIDRILASTGRLRTTLPLAQDPELARLESSMAIGNLLLANDLAAAGGLEFAPPQFLEEPIPESVLDVISVHNTTALIQNEDAAGYSLEVIAAMQEPDERATALQQAKVHRETAEFWAATAGVSQTAQDPRTVAYALPFELTKDVPVASADELRQLAHGLTTELATGYVDLIALAAPESRMFYFDNAIRVMFLDTAWGKPSGPLPYFSSSEQFLAPTAETDSLTR